MLITTLVVSFLVCFRLEVRCGSVGVVSGLQPGHYSSLTAVRIVSRTAQYHPHRTLDIHSGSQDHHPSKNSVQKTIRCNSTSNTPDDGRIYPKHVELRIHKKIIQLHQVGISLYFRQKCYLLLKLLELHYVRSVQKSYRNLKDPF